MHWLCDALLTLIRTQVEELVRTSCEDGKDFIRAIITRALDCPMPAAAPPMSKTQKRKLQQAKHTQGSSSPSVPTRTRVTQFVMNLPDTAILFLDAFRGLLSPANIGGRDLSGLYAEMPTVHCYCFTRELEPEKVAADIRQVCALLVVSSSKSHLRLFSASGSSMNLDILWATRFRTTMCGPWLPIRRCTASASGSHEKWPSERSL